MWTVWSVLRASVSTALVALVITAGASAQQQTTSWDEWLRAVRPLIALKERGIRDGTEYRDKICPAQQTERQRQDCNQKAGKFIVYRMLEKQMYQMMQDAFDANLDEKEAIATAINPVAQKLNKPGTDLDINLQQLYPRSR